MLGGGAAQAATATRAPFGTLPDGRSVEAVTLSNARSTSIRIITLGAGVQSLLLPDRNGRIDDVALGYDTAAEYLVKPHYFGSSIGRYSNRIARGQFTLDGRSYQLATNNNGQHLHGGAHGFDKKLWSIDGLVSSGNASVTMRYTSPDAEEGFPGTLQASVTYALDDQNNFTIRYRATTDRPTIVSLTNHNYWNLAGLSSGRGIEDQRLTVHASRYTPVDAVLIPTGTLADVANTPFDFRKAAPIGPRMGAAHDAQIVAGRGIDHHYAIDGTGNRPAVRIEDPASGRVLELELHDAPGLQVYTGNFLDGTVSGKGRLYRMGDAIALEPQAFPDTPNQPVFGSARLDPGQVYTNSFTYRFSIAR
jgi:aldose 1-epimerase